MRVPQQDHGGVVGTTPPVLGCRNLTGGGPHPSARVCRWGEVPPRYACEGGVLVVATMWEARGGFSLPVSSPHPVV